MASLDELDPRISGAAHYLVREMAIHAQVRVTSAYRSPSEQLELWRTRATNRYPVAPPGRSYHEYRRAFDLSAPLWLLYEAGRIWQSWGGTWGGARDPIHFQV